MKRATYLLLAIFIIACAMGGSNPMLASTAESSSDDIEATFFEKINQLDASVRDAILDDIRNDDTLGETEKIAFAMMRLFNETLAPNERLSKEYMAEIAALAQHDAETFSAQLAYQNEVHALSRKAYGAVSARQAELVCKDTGSRHQPTHADCPAS